MHIVYEPIDFLCVEEQCGFLANLAFSEYEYMYMDSLSIWLHYNFYFMLLSDIH